MTVLIRRRNQLTDNFVLALTSLAEDARKRKQLHLTKRQRAASLHWFNALAQGLLYAPLHHAPPADFVHEPSKCLLPVDADHVLLVNLSSREGALLHLNIEAGGDLNLVHRTSKDPQLRAVLSAPLPEALPSLKRVLREFNQHGWASPSLY